MTKKEFVSLLGEQARADMRKAATLRASDQTLDAMADALAPLYAQAAQARIDARARNEAEQARRDALVARSGQIASQRVRKAAALLGSLSVAAGDASEADHKDTTTTPRVRKAKRVRLPDVNRTATDTNSLLAQLEARHMARLAALGVGVDAPEAPAQARVDAEVEAVLAATRYREAPRRNYSPRRGGQLPGHLATLQLGA